MAHGQLAAAVQRPILLHREKVHEVQRLGSGPHAGRISLPETLGRLATDAQRSVSPKQDRETNGRTFFFFFNIYLFIWLPWVLEAERRIFDPHCGTQDL